jgi:hypothetical protein
MGFRIKPEARLSTGHHDVLHRGRVVFLLPAHETSLLQNELLLLDNVLHCRSNLGGTRIFAWGPCSQWVLAFWRGSGRMFVLA